MQTRTSSPRVSVVVPHYHDLARLGLCLDALVRQNYAADRVEIIVADNGSPAGEAAVREAIAGRARLVLAPEKGAGPARNAGAAAAEGEVLAFTDADCVPEPGWLAAGVAALAGADLVGGRVTVFTQDPDRLSPAEAFECAFAFDNARYVQRLGFTVTANGGGEFRTPQLEPTQAEVRLDIAGVATERFGPKRIGIERRTVELVGALTG